MIEGNRIKLGYGDVIISSKQQGWIKFTQIRNSVECGHTIKSIEELENLGTDIEITLTEYQPFELCNILKTVSRDNPIVEYKGYIFDFSNYNENSVSSAVRGAKNMVNLIPLAC